MSMGILIVMGYCGKEPIVSEKGLIKCIDDEAIRYNDRSYGCNLVQEVPTVLTVRDR